MSLYVRVLNNFYTHRKTLRLKAAIGEDAYWLPPRLWSYAAENQPDGCFKDYSAQELAMLLGYLGDAQAMLKAMLQAGFLESDPLRIHDWDEHNGYHSTFADRAKKAADARWSKTREQKDKTVPERKGKETSIACRNATSIPSATPPPPCNEHSAFIDGWVQNFKAKFGFDYVFDGGRDGKAVRELLRMQILRIDLLEIAKSAWSRAGQSPKAFNCEQASTIHGFKSYFNQIQVELKNGSTAHRSDNRPDRNAGIVGHTPGRATRILAEREAREAAAKSARDSVATKVAGP